MPWLVLALIAFWFLAGDNSNGEDGGGDSVVSDLLNTITRGARVTRASYGADGVVRVAPQALADQAGVPIDVYSLARAMSSEEGRSDTTTQAAVGWCMVNEANRRGTSVTALVTRANNPAHSGYYGTQGDLEYKAATGTGKSDRYCSTALDPYEGEITIAQGIYDGSIADLTGGCNQFDRPGGEANPDRVAATRIAAGAELVAVDGTDAGLRFWRTG